MLITDQLLQCISLLVAPMLSLLCFTVLLIGVSARHRCLFVCFLTSVIYESLQVNTFLLKHCSEPLLSVILRGFVVVFFCDYLIKISQQNLPHCDSDSITTLNEKRGNV